MFRKGAFPCPTCPKHYFYTTFFYYFLFSLFHLYHIELITYLCYCYCSPPSFSENSTYIKWVPKSTFFASINFIVFIEWVIFHINDFHYSVPVCVLLELSIISCALLLLLPMDYGREYRFFFSGWSLLIVFSFFEVIITDYYWYCCYYYWLLCTLEIYSIFCCCWEWGWDKAMIMGYWLLLEDGARLFKRVKMEGINWNWDYCAVVFFWGDFENLL